MTAGTRPSRRTERAAPLPVPLRVTAASCLIAAMMMSLTELIAPRLQGCRNRREGQAYRGALFARQDPAPILFWLGSYLVLVSSSNSKRRAFFGIHKSGET